MIQIEKKRKRSRNDGDDAGSRSENKLKVLRGQVVREESKS